MKHLLASLPGQAHAACEWIARGPLAPQEGVALIKEVWELVDQVYADVRGSGFSREKWQQLRDEALSRSLPDRAAAEVSDGVKGGGNGGEKGLNACSMTAAAGLRDKYWAVRCRPWCLGVKYPWQWHVAISRWYHGAATRYPQRVVRRMLAEGVADPYTRYLSRGEFQEMLKYDVTGIGLNLGSLEDLRNKV